ncbi:MAG: hypothetical protein GY754_38075, partial [bacterium]|nr:hypothetical protein [bacterium]
MSDDLLGRLRRKGRWVTVKRVPLFPQENEEEWRPDADSAEAADEIERLEAENADLRSRASSTLPAAVKAAASA